MSAVPETSQVRHFGPVALRIILYLQHDIQELEAQLLQAEYEDSRSIEGEASLFAINLRALKNSDPNTAAGRQHRLFLELKEKYKEYGMKSYLALINLLS